MAIHDVTREYTPGACCNSRKLIRLPHRCKMRPDSPAFHAEEFRFPIQKCKEHRFPWWNWREFPRTLSQQEKNTDVTSGMQNRLVYPKWTQDEAHFPFIESIAISHSTSYTTSVLTSITTIQRFPETPISSLLLACWICEKEASSPAVLQILKRFSPPQREPDLQEADVEGDRVKRLKEARSSLRNYVY